MTLLDAPVFDERRERRRKTALLSGAGLLFVLFIGWWLVAGRPVDWPWNWNNHLLGRSAVNRFLTAVEQNDLGKAYGIWLHDPDWQQHEAEYAKTPYEQFLQTKGYDPAKQGAIDKDTAKKLADDYGAAVHDKDWRRHHDDTTQYPFSRFQIDWSSTSPDNTYGVIKSHQIVAERMYGNVLLTAVLINGRKSGALNLDYDPKDHTLNFSPEGVEIYLGP